MYAVRPGGRRPSRYRPELRVYDASQLARMRAVPLRLTGRTEMGVGMGHGVRWLSLASIGIPLTGGGEARLDRRRDKQG